MGLGSLYLHYSGLHYLYFYLVLSLSIGLVQFGLKGNLEHGCYPLYLWKLYTTTKWDWTSSTLPNATHTDRPKVTLATLGTEHITLLAMLGPSLCDDATIICGELFPFSR